MIDFENRQKKSKISKISFFLFIHSIISFQTKNKILLYSNNKNNNNNKCQLINNHCFLRRRNYLTLPAISLHSATPRPTQRYSLNRPASRCNSRQCKRPPCHSRHRRRRRHPTAIALVSVLAMMRMLAPRMLISINNGKR